MPCALAALLLDQVAGNQRNSVLKISTGFDQSGTSFCQSSPDLLRVFEVYVPLGRPSLGTRLDAGLSGTDYFFLLKFDD